VFQHLEKHQSFEDTSFKDFSPTSLGHLVHKHVQHCERLAVDGATNSCALHLSIDLVIISIMSILVLLLFLLLLFYLFILLFSCHRYFKML
jgi:hypothetical protein